MRDTPKSPPLVTRRVLLAGSLFGVAGALASAAGPSVAASYAAIPRLPGETARTATVTSRTGRSRYEVIDVMVGGDPVRLFVPHTAGPSATRRQGMVWFFHANGSNHKSLSTAFGYAADQLADDGLVSICPNFGGTTWTGPRALELLRAVVDWTNGLWNITASLLRATSAGGALMTWAYGNGLIPAVIGGYTVNGVYDMEERAQRLPDDTIDDYDGDWGLLAASNPARMPGSVWQGTRLRITGTPADTVVPFASHGRALHAAASPFAADASLWETPATGTGGHGVPSATNRDMLDTFRRWLVDAENDTSPLPSLPGAGTYENGSDQIALTGTWAVLTSSKDSGGSIAHSSSSGASATLAFTGTGVRWISRTTPASGINEVVLDGIVVATVDRYSPSSQYSQTVWTSPTLERGDHTVTIRRTGRKNAASTGSNIVLDALVVVDAEDETPPSPSLPGAGTYENGSEQISVTGTWATLTSAKDSGGSIAHSSTSGASATLAFTGTGVSWISRTTPSSGINEVVLDGIVVATVDRYSPSTQYSQTVWASPTLARGEHTVTIRRTGRKNSASTGSNIVLDALVVVDTDTPPSGGEQVPLPDPVARWAFDQAAPPFASDAGNLVLQVGTGAIASGHSAGTNLLARTTVANRTGLRFGGQNYLQIDPASVGALNVGATTGKVTVSCWFYNEDSNGGAIAGVWREDNNNPARSYCLFYDLPYYNGDERVCGHVSRFGGATPGYPYSKDYSTSAEPISRAGVWEHYAFTYDGQQAISYLNGQGTNRYTGPFTDPNGNVHDEVKNPYSYALGLNPTPAEFTVGAVKLTAGMGNLIRGVVADLRVYDQALSPQQIQALATM